MSYLHWFSLHHAVYEPPDLLLQLRVVLFLSYGGFVDQPQISQGFICVLPEMTRLNFSE